MFRIFYEVVAPIFVLIGIGFLAQKRVGFDVRSLTRLNIWVFVPGFLFISIIDSHLSGRQVGLILLHCACLFPLMFALAWSLAPLVGARDRMRRAITASVLFYNSGNYGIPVARLAFPAPAGGSMGAGEAVQVVVIMFQNISNFTIGLFLMASGRGRSRRQTIQEILKLPMIYVLFAALLWRATHLPLPKPLDVGLHLLREGLVPVALVTLGVQMATLKSHRLGRELWLSLGLRLVVAPLIGLGLVYALGIRGSLGQAMVISTSFPTAINSALLAIEFDNEPEFAASAVFYSTLLSSVTVSLVIALVRQLDWLQ